MPMIPLSPAVEYNGHRYSRTSCNLRWGVIQIAGWKSLNQKSSRAPGMTYGSRSNPQGRTRGKMTYTADIELYEEDFQTLKARLVAQGALLSQGWMEVANTIVLTVYEPTRGAVVVTLLGAQVTDVEQAIGDNDDQLSRKLTLSVMNILDEGAPAVLENTSIGR